MKFIGLPLAVVTVNLEINGFIDLGPNWNYEYKIKTDTAVERPSPIEAKREGKDIDIHDHKAEMHKHTTMAILDEETTVDSNKGNKKLTHVADFKTNEAKREGKEVGHYEHITNTQSHETPMQYKHTTKGIMEESTTTVKSKIGLKKLMHDSELEANEVAKRERENFGKSEHNTITLADTTRTKHKHSTKGIQEEITTKVDFNSHKKEKHHKTQLAVTEVEYPCTKHNEHKTITHADTTPTKHKHSTKGIEEEITTKVDFKSKKEKHHKIKRLAVTEVEYPYTKHSKKPLKSLKVFHEARSVKEDKHINDFALHVYRQTLSVFDVIKKKVDPRYAHKVDLLARSYDDKFRRFVNETLNHKIRTRLGDQKVVLNTIETSNRLLKRLVNYFMGELDKYGYSNHNAISNVLQKEVEKESAHEYRHACTKFGICRTESGFNKFMIDVYTILLGCNDRQIKQASDALTEVLKNTDFSDILEEYMLPEFHKEVSKAELYDADIFRGIFANLKNMHALQNQPLKVMTRDRSYVDSTVAFYEVINELEKAIPPNERNVSEWTEIKNGLTDWKVGRRLDILNIMNRFVKHIHDGTKNMDAPTHDNFRFYLHMALFGTALPAER